jgi:hypothetical protein
MISVRTRSLVAATRSSDLFDCAKDLLIEAIAREDGGVR